MKLKSQIPHLKGIALVAHDNKKYDLIQWVKKHQAELSNHNLYGSGTTGRYVEAETGIQITKLNSGPLGGDQQIGAKISEGEIDVLIFFWDPLQAQPHDSDVKALIRIAAVYNIPVACNESSADFLITSPYFTGEYEKKMDDFSSHMNRSIPKK